MNIPVKKEKRSAANSRESMNVLVMSDIWDVE